MPCKHIFYVQYVYFLYILVISLSTFCHIFIFGPLRLMFIITIRFSVMADQVSSVPSEGIKSLTARSNDVLKSVEFPKKSSEVICKSNTFSRLLAAGEDRKGPGWHLSHLLSLPILAPLANLPKIFLWGSLVFEISFQEFSNWSNNHSMSYKLLILDRCISAKGMFGVYLHKYGCLQPMRALRLGMRTRNCRVYFHSRESIHHSVQHIHRYLNRNI